MQIAELLRYQLFLGPTLIDMDTSLRNEFHEYICEYQRRLVDKLASCDIGAPNPTGDWAVKTAEVKDSSGNSCLSEHISRAYVFPAAPDPNDLYRRIERAGVFVSKITYEYTNATPGRGGFDGFDVNGIETLFIPSPAENLKQVPLFRAGVSIIIHPREPQISSSHANFQYAEHHPQNNSAAIGWSFSGGFDLTPSYVNVEHFRKFHTELKAACKNFPFVRYEELKANCDKQFYIPHREEYRGIGGIYFTISSLSTKIGQKPQEVFALVKACAEAFLKAYSEILDSDISPHIVDPERERRWQLARHGRSAEWTLVNSKGFLYGLYKVPADHLFVSVAETLRFEHDGDLEIMMTTAEKDMEEILKSPRDWAE